MKNTATLTKWGNSFGIRIPKSLIDMSHAYLGEEFSIEPHQNGGFILAPIKSPRANWTDAFNQIAASQEEPDPFAKLEHSFDKNEWTW